MTLAAAIAKEFRRGTGKVEEENEVIERQKSSVAAAIFHFLARSVRISLVPKSQIPNQSSRRLRELTSTESVKVTVTAKAEKNNTCV